MSFFKCDLGHILQTQQDGTGPAPAKLFGRQSYGGMVLNCCACRTVILLTLIYLDPWQIDAFEVKISILSLILCWDSVKEINEQNLTNYWYQFIHLKVNLLSFLNIIWVYLNTWMYLWMLSTNNILVNICWTRGREYSL